MGNGKVYPQEHAADNESKYTDGTTPDWLAMKGLNHVFDIIVANADPDGAAHYDAAPLGSLYIENLAANVKLHIKDAATTFTEIGD